MPATPNRLTIQLDLGGFSFTIYDRNGIATDSGEASFAVALSDESVKKVLVGQYEYINIFFSTIDYLLVPTEFFTKDEAAEILFESRGVSESERVSYWEIPGQKAVMVFAMPSENPLGMRWDSSNVRYYPMIYYLIDRIPSLSSNNRLLISYRSGYIDIVAAERDRLLFANSFPAGDEVTAQYFIFSVAQQVLFNPEHTFVYHNGKISDRMRSALLRYFPEVVQL